MPNLGLSELLVIAMILMLVFGASRLPALGEGLGKTLRSFKRGLSSDDKIEVSERARSAGEAPTQAAQPAASGAEETETPPGGPEPVEAEPVNTPKAPQSEPDRKRDASDAEIID